MLKTRYYFSSGFFVLKYKIVCIVGYTNMSTCSTALTSNGEYNLVINQGATYKLGFTWKNKTTGQPIDITGSTITMELKPSNGTTITYDNGGNGGIDIVNGEDGTFSLVITDEQTLAYTFIRGRYIILVEFSNGEKQKFLSGNVKVVKKFKYS